MTKPLTDKMKLQESGFQLPSFLPRLSYEKQDTLLKLLILSICAVLCKYNKPHDLLSNEVQCSLIISMIKSFIEFMPWNITCKTLFIGPLRVCGQNKSYFAILKLYQCIFNLKFKIFYYRL